MENNGKNYAFKIFVTTALALTLAALICCCVFLGLSYTEKPCACRPFHEKPPETVINFDTDGGNELPPMVFGEEYYFRDFDYFYGAYKPNYYFLGWQYEGKYIEEYDIATFKKPGEYTFKAVWQPVDSLKEYQIEQGLFSLADNPTHFYSHFDRNGYTVSFNVEGAQYGKFYEAGIAAIDIINNFKNNNAVLDASIKQYNIYFSSQDYFAFNTRYDNVAGEEVVKLSDMSASYGNPVSLLTREEYQAIKDSYIT
jgi:hypothetical protein